MTADEDLRMARDEVWQALAAAPIRRAMLGRERCDRLVRVAMSKMPPTDLAAAGEGTGDEAAIRRHMERRVSAVYSEPCGLAFTTFILSWAISAIVQALVIRWWNQHREGVAS